MRSNPSLVTLAVTCITAFVIIAFIFMSSAFARSDEHMATQLIETCETTNRIVRAPRMLNESDKIALLERIQYALSQMGDGSTYVWRRWHGGLSATVNPTASFKDDIGQICRHVVILLSNGKRTKKAEGIACRLPDGRWQLDG